MKTRTTIHWLAGLAGGLLLAVPAVGWTDIPWGAGGIVGALEACEDELAQCQEQPGITFPGDGQTGSPLAYEEADPPDGTFTDLNTGLMWEVKTGTVGDPVECSHDLFPEACFNVADVNNRYTWTDPIVGDDTDPDGTAFTFFLVMRNQTCRGETDGAPCANDADCASAAIPYCGLGGHTDWRLPTVKELQSLVDYGIYYPAASVPGETVGVPVDPTTWNSAHYWSSTSYAHLMDDYAWGVYFFDGDLIYGRKDLDFHVRAVRGGW